MKQFTNFTFIALLIFMGSCNSSEEKAEVDKLSFIQPWTENPTYWQYKGQPVLLLGATDNDNLFQNTNLESHLDSLKSIGGNYIRNTMSDRDPGDQKAYHLNSSGKYDLNQWNEKYWERFENMLRLTSDREIIVQIEIWDRFDHSREQWIGDPFNPKNNVNYTYQEAGLDSLYPDHPGRNQQPFFFTVPELENNDLLLNHQKAFVKKLLSISLNYDNVLYCIDNETSGMEEWATFWAGFITENTEGKTINLTQMWDNWDVKSDTHKRTLDHPERYQYVDMSQNSHNIGKLNWDNARYVLDYVQDNARPVNSTKIYGNSSYEPWLNRGLTSENAVENFFKNILGGFASSRFHRPPHGLGLSELPINSILTIRKIEEKVKMWELEPKMELLIDVEENQAYLSANEGEKYLIFLPQGGNIHLDLKNHESQFQVYIMDTVDPEWQVAYKIQGGDIVELKSDLDTNSFIIVIRD